MRMIFHLFLHFFFVIILSLMQQLYTYGQRPHGSNHYCNIPGLPAGGNITPYKEHYIANDQINYTCQLGYLLEGLKENSCDENFTWKIPATPLCRKNVAYKMPTHMSTQQEAFCSENVVDGNKATCAITLPQDSRRLWTVKFEDSFEIEKVFITAYSVNAYYNLSVTLMTYNSSSKKYQNKICALISSRNDAQHLARWINCSGHAQFLKIQDLRVSSKSLLLQLCEVEVYRKLKPICGSPARHPNCLTKAISKNGQEMVQYSAKPGYSIEVGKYKIVCIGGDWVGNVPKCYKNRDYTTASNEGSLSTEGRSNSNKNSTQVGSNFIIGVSIGVTAASVSTIVVIVVVIVVMRKYYRRNNDHCGTVSDSEGIFLRANPSSSVHSGSPTIQPTYSRPWDDPAFHMYEYIGSDTIPKPPTNPRPNHKNEDDIKLDTANYLANRSSMKQHRTDDSGDPVVRTSLLYPPSSVYSDGNRNQQGRVNSFNELEVEAYGYPEADDTCRV